MRLLWRLLLVWAGVARRRYRRCLAHIDRLERELFPEWFKNDLALWDFHPGAIWTVDDPRDIQFFPAAGLTNTQLINNAICLLKDDYS